MNAFRRLFLLCLCLIGVAGCLAIGNAGVNVSQFAFYATFMVGMAVTADQLAVRSDDCLGSCPVAASTLLYANTLVFRNSSGYADDDIASGANPFLGIARRQYDNSAGSNGDITAEFYIDGVFLLTGSGFAQTSVGKLAYASDNFTLTLTATDNALIGVIVGYKSSTQVYVKITPQPARASGASQAAVATTGATNSSPYGFTTAAQADAIVTLVNALRTALLNAGIIKGS